MKNNKKLNDGCIKIFKFLNLLYEDNAEYDKVLEIFKGENETPKENIQVTLNRYINTLKVFGIKIEKENTKYKIQNSIYSMNFTDADLKAISILTEYIQHFPNKKLSAQMQNFLGKLELRMNNSDKNTLNSLLTTNEYDFSFYYSNIREQIIQCEKICSERQFITITYIKNNEKLKCRGVLKEVIYGSKTVSIKVYNSEKHTNLDIPINNILSITSLPQVAGQVEMPMTVVFKLKGRLAKTYKLKENEISKGYDEEGRLIIVNNDESWDKLSQRLLRYTDCCEIISPKNLREEMIKLISDTIKNYESGEE